MSDTSIVLILGFAVTLITVMTPIVKLNTTITELNTMLDEFKQQMEKSNETINKRLDAHSKELDDLKLQAKAHDIFIENYNRGEKKWKKELM